LIQAIDVPHKFFERYQGETYQGRVVFVDGAGRRYERKFILHPKQMAGTLAYGHEAVRTHYELQQIPKILDEIKNEIKKLAQR
jgi:hypothetical protein